MNKQTLKIFLLGAALLTVGVFIFIHFNNDHMECENYTEHSKVKTVKKLRLKDTYVGKNLTCKVKAAEKLQIETQNKI